MGDVTPANQDQPSKSRPSKPSLPQGTRDFGPDVVQKRNFIFNTIRSVFELHGFQPLETPAMENLETLLGKYGEEGDKLIFKILNNGLGDPKNIDKARAAFENVLQGKNDRNLTERALKYDLTIPFARYVAMNHGRLAFPFRRYQVQPVWRADRPQRGRYREFYQCDADIVGSRSLLNEVELALVYSEVFRRLGIDVEIRINSRRILSALADVSGGQHLMIPLTVAIDKLDKIGHAGVAEEMQKLGIDANRSEQILQFISSTRTSVDASDDSLQFLGGSSQAAAGLEELRYVLSMLANTEAKNDVVVDFSLARGLNYYTGIIFEVRAENVQIGSIGGGGRYDDLTGLFGVPDLPGVGISFGVDRIYDVMEEMNLFPEAVHHGTMVLFFNLGDTEARTAFDFVRGLRKRGIASEIYHEASKLDKQFKYAEKKGIPYVVIIGSRELENKTCNVKNIISGDQKEVAFDELYNQFI
ncbi:MAG TPA: histidine--tRNA ligase [Flavisolibacter sp.]